MQLARAAAVALQEVKKFIPKLWRIARELFHEVMGFIFIALALFFTFGRQGLIKAVQDVQSDPDSFPRLLLVAVFVLMFGGFGVSSFLRAKRISRGR